MSLAPFFSRTYSAVGSHLEITRDELEIVLSKTRVGIHLDDRCSVDGNDKWIAELLVNLMARLYPKISITGADSSCENVASIAKAINPSIDILDNLEGNTVTVCIGKPCNVENSFSTSVSGWVAYVGTTSKHVLHGPNNPYSAGAAAALSAWRVFQQIFSDKRANGIEIPDVSVSLLDFSTSKGKRMQLPNIDIGEVAFAGIGAVGNPALWAFSRHKGLNGLLHLIDPDDVELSNLQRYCLPNNADVGISKVQLAERELEGSKINLKTWPCTLEDFASSYKEVSLLKTICVSVDNIEGRRTAQALLPKLVINGWTSNSGLGASWHRFLGKTACLGCLYHPSGTVQSQTEMAASALGMDHKELADLWVKEQPLAVEKITAIETHLGLKAGSLDNWTGKRVQDVYSGVVCGQIGVELEALGRIATVPLAHQSVLAGILMAVELIKRTSELERKCQKQSLVIWDDVMRVPPKYWAVMRAKKAECFCLDPDYQQVYKQKWE